MKKASCGESYGWTKKHNVLNFYTKICTKNLNYKVSEGV